jgi:5,10-methylenetetrahydrofolate reductase
MTVQVWALRGDPVDIGDHEAEHEKHKDGQKKIKRMIKRHGCALGFTASMLK